MQNQSRRHAPQEQLDMRALEMASSTQAVLNQHLIECRDRYVAFNQKAEDVAKELKRLILSIGGGTIVGLFIIIGYLVAHGGIPVIH